MAEHRLRNHDNKYRLLAAHYRASQREEGGRCDVILVPAVRQFPGGRLRLVGSQVGKKHTNWWWKEPNRLL